MNRDLKKELLSLIFGEKKDVYSDALLLQKCRDSWSYSAGNMAVYSEPVRIKSGVLTVRLEKSVYMQEFSFLQNALLNRLNEKGISVRSIKYEMGPIRKISETSLNHDSRRKNPSDNKRELNEAQKELLEGLKKRRG